MNDKLPIKCVIFDMDGLLVDSEKVYSKGWLLAAKQIGTHLSKETTQKLVGKGFIETENILINTGKTPDEIAKMRLIRENYIKMEAMAGRIEAKPFAREVLTDLKSKGFKIALASSTASSRAKLMLNSLDLLNLIDFPVFGDEVKYQKPNPEPYLEATKRASISVHEAIAVEDSITGVTSASVAGLKVIMIPDTSFVGSIHMPTAVVRVGKSLKVVLDYLNIKE